MDLNRRPLTVAGSVLHEELSGSIDLLVTRVFSELVEVLPAYAAFPAEEVRGEIAPIIATTIQFFAEAVRRRELPPPEILAPLGDGAGRRAEEGVALQDLLTAYHLGCTVARDHVTANATSADYEDVNALDRLLLGFLAQVTAVVATGYLRMSNDTVQEAQGAKGALLDALLDGGDSVAVARRVGLVLPSAYVVLALSIGPHPDELLADVDSATVRVRKLRRLRHDLDAMAPDALAVMTSEAASVLLPLRQGEGVWKHLDRAVAQLSRAAGAPVLAATTTTEPAAVWTAVRLAEDVLEVGRRAGRLEGLIELRDFLVEFQLSRPSAATAPLAALLDPLAPHCEILETLRAFMLVHGQDRRRTASELHVHPNTVDYRLRKVSTLTGLNPNDAKDAQRLLAALSARRLTEPA